MPSFVENQYFLLKSIIGEFNVMTSNNLVSEDCNNKHRSAAFQQSQLDELKRQMDLLASAIRWEDPSSYMHLANNAAGIVRSIDPLSIFAYTDIIRVFKGIIEVVDEQKGSQSSIARWKNCMTCLTTIFPADHLMLSDVCKSLPRVNSIV